MIRFVFFIQRYDLNSLIITKLGKILNYLLKGLLHFWAINFLLNIANWYAKQSENLKENFDEFLPDGRPYRSGT